MCPRDPGSTISDPPTREIAFGAFATVQRGTGPPLVRASAAPAHARHSITPISTLRTIALSRSSIDTPRCNRKN
jgi:hypothetical protein